MGARSAQPTKPQRREGAASSGAETRAPAKTLSASGAGKPAGSAARKKAGGRAKAAAQPSPKRGRPPGIRLPTGQRLRRLLAMIRSGASPPDAAAAIGINRRTFREWMERARGEHLTRRPTRQLVEFADVVAQAQSEARVHAQLRLHRDDEKTWLRIYGTAHDGEGGLSGGAPSPGRHPNVVEHLPSTAEQAAEVVDILLKARAFETPPCSDPECPCEFHRNPAQDDEPTDPERRLP